MSFVILRSYKYGAHFQKERISSNPIHHSSTILEPSHQLLSLFLSSSQPRTLVFDMPADKNIDFLGVQRMTTMRAEEEATPIDSIHPREGYLHLASDNPSRCPRLTLESSSTSTWTYRTPDSHLPMSDSAATTPTTPTSRCQHFSTVFSNYLEPVRARPTHWYCCQW